MYKMMTELAEHFEYKDLAPMFVEVVDYSLLVVVAIVVKLLFQNGVLVEQEALASAVVLVDVLSFCKIPVEEPEHL